MITKVINNLHTYRERVDYDLAVKLADLIERNFKSSNTGEYTEEEISRLLVNKTSDNIFDFLCHGLSVIIYEDEQIAAFGMIVRKNNLYEAKYLNVCPDFKGRGLGKTICEVREKHLKDMGVRELYIESLRFKKTMEFHKKRGFYDIPSIRKLYFTNYMKKDL